MASSSGSGLTLGTIGNQTVGSTDDPADPSNPAPSVRVQVDGKDAARLSFRQAAGLKAAESLGELMALGLTIVAVSREGHGKAAWLSKRVGADLGGGEMGTAEKIRFLKKLARSGRRAASPGTAGAFTGALNGRTPTLLANVGGMNVNRRRLLDGKLAPV